MAAEAEMERFIEGAGEVVAAVYNATMRDGTIDAFLRQGANELGAALKAFPDTIQIDEPGAVFNPLYSDIAADRREAMYGQDRLPTPSEVAEIPIQAPDQSQGLEQSQGRSM